MFIIMKGKKLYLKETKEKTIPELIGERKKLQKQLYEFKMKNAIRGLKQTHQIADAKKKIARINTVLQSKIKK